MTTDSKTVGRRPCKALARPRERATLSLSNSGRV